MSRISPLAPVLMACGLALALPTLAGAPPRDLMPERDPDAADLAVPESTKPAPAQPQERPVAAPGTKADDKPSGKAPRKMPSMPSFDAVVSAVTSAIPTADPKLAKSPPPARVPTIAEKQAAAAGEARAVEPRDHAPAPPPPSDAAAPAVTVAEPTIAAAPVPAPLVPVLPAETPAVQKVRLELTPQERTFAAEEETLLRRIRLLDLELEVSERMAKLTGTPATGVAAAGAVASTVISRVPDAVTSTSFAAPAAQAAAAARHPFRLLSIWGNAGSLRAEFAVSGARRVVKAGEMIEGGWILEAVNHGDVVVSQGRQRETLRIGY